MPETVASAGIFAPVGKGGRSVDLRADPNDGGVLDSHQAFSGRTKDESSGRNTLHLSHLSQMSDREPSSLPLGVERTWQC